MGGFALDASHPPSTPVASESEDDDDDNDDGDDDDASDDANGDASFIDMSFVICDKKGE